MRRLVVERILRLSGPSLVGVYIWAEDATRKAKDTPVLVGESEADVLRQLAGAVEKFGSLDGVAEAIHKAHAEARNGGYTGGEA